MAFKLVEWINGVTKLNKATMDTFQNNIKSEMNLISNNIDAIMEILESNNVYSAQETKVGTWKDGKTIYRKVVSSTLGSSANTEKTVYTDSNIDNIVDLKAIIRTVSGNQTPIPNSIVSIYSKAGSITVNHTNSTFNSIPIDVILEYTKVNE